MTSLAVVPSPAETAIAQLQVLRSRLEVEGLDMADAVDVRNQAETVRAYVRSARLGREVADEACELRLRAERRCGAILIELAVDGRRQVLPRRTLEEFGLSAKDSSRFQLLAKIPTNEFDARLSALRAAGRQIAILPFIRASREFVRTPVGGRPSTPAASLLRRALRLLREVSVIRSRDELELARQVVKIGTSWSTVVNIDQPKPLPTRAVQRQVSCLLCGRGRPASRPPACPSCGGRWLEA